MNAKSLGLIGLVLILFASHATATVRTEPVKLSLAEAPTLVKAGELFNGTLVITATRTVDLLSVDIDGGRWADFSADRAANPYLEKDGVARVSFRGVPRSLNDTVVIRVETDLGPFEAVLDLRSWAADRSVRSGRAVPIDPSAAEPRPAYLGDPTPPGEARNTPPHFLPPAGVEIGPDATDLDDPPVADKSTRRSIRVVGRLQYMRDDGWTIAAEGVTARVYDEDSTWDELLATTHLDANGVFDVSFTWDPCGLCDGQPDLYVEFETDDGNIQVQDSTILETDYSWSTNVHDDYRENYLDFGDMRPESDSPALHIWNTAYRTRKWLMAERGLPDLFDFDVQWPETDFENAYYNAYFGEIHISATKQWREDTITHEMGHHLDHMFNYVPDPDYCNSWCDENHDWPFPDCGHCMWCEENPNDAWSEGVCNFIADIVTARVPMDGDGSLAHYRRNVENVSTCDGTNYHPSLKTEGFVSALLHDIADGQQDDHTMFPGRDQLGDGSFSGTDEILEIFTHDYHVPVWPETDPADLLTVQHFMDEYLARHPEKGADLWATASNCGYELDDTPPLPPSNLSCSTHTLGSISTRAYFTFWWDPPVDDLSGIAGYSYALFPNTPQMPEAIINRHATVSVAIGPVPVATYYFCIRAVDEAGNWSNSYAWTGPYTVRDPLPIDLSPFQPGGWDYNMVPHTGAVGTPTSTHVTPTLTGNLGNTYFSFAGINLSDQATLATTLDFTFFLDGTWKHSAQYGRLYPWESFKVNNMGPRNFYGGRHTFEVRHDFPGQEPEENESNNNWARQFVWTPLELSTTGVQLRNIHLPWREGSWDALLAGYPMYFNSDGLRMLSTSAFTAVAVRPHNNALDYDVRLHQPSTGSQDGFAEYVARSVRPEGMLDAVIVNRNTVGLQTWDIGVLNRDDEVGYPYDITYEKSTPFSMGFTEIISFAQDEMIDLKEIYVSANDVAWGPVTVTLENLGTQNDVIVGWLTRDFTLGGLLDAPISMSVPHGETQMLDVTAAGAGSCCLVIYRDQFQGTAPMDVRLKVEKQRPNLTAINPIGWLFPLIPRNTGGASGSSVPLTLTLPGNTLGGTYINASLRNTMAGTTDTEFEYQIMTDGNVLATRTVPTLAGATTYSDYNLGPYYHRGGRHTLGLRIDEPDDVGERDETDNGYSMQWIWTPAAYALGTFSGRSMPTDPIGGWEDLTSDVYYYNCDGLRLTAPSPSAHMYGALAVMPGDTSDVDVRLHTASPSCLAGFGTYLASSSWGPGQSDFVMVNYAAASWQDFDVGVVKASGAQTYNLQAAGSTYLGANPYGSHGPFTLAPMQIVDLHHVYFDPYQTTFIVRTYHPEARVGMALFNTDYAYFGKGDFIVPTTEVEMGTTTQFTMNIPVDGDHCLVVWRKDRAAFYEPVEYSFDILGGTVTDLPPPSVVTKTEITGAAPNPFNPMTTVSFTIATAGQSEVDVYDTRGRLVRTLTRGLLESGRHEVSWDGRDDSGAVVSGGAYLIRLRSGPIVDIRKVILVK